ncbi:hypothetical protein N8Z28_01470 [bacterium]|nr:hypothetical protein [bacterium]
MIKIKIKIYAFIKFIAWTNKKIAGGNTHEKIININLFRDINAVLYKIQT